MIKLYSQNKHYKLYNGSMLDMLDVIDENSVDAIVTDPPYELGFMGKSWDSSGVAFQKETWEKCLKVLKPGGHILAFGGSRTFYRIACAIEDAGFEIRDTIMWLYGSGFPKSLNIGLAVDKKNGVESEVVGKGKSGVSSRAYQSEELTTAGEYEIKEACNKWSGWGTALKPSFEPIIVARKPFNGSLVDNVLKHGVGGYNIDECRIETNDDLNGGAYRGKNTRQQEDATSYYIKSPKLDGKEYKKPEGRFPANTILTYDETDFDEVCGGFPNSGNGNGKGAYSYKGVEYHNKDTSMFNGDKPQSPSNYNDSGSASRYFYCAKASKEDREEGCEELEMKVLHRVNSGDLENEERFKPVPRKNAHPTVKPTDLMQYLIRLVTPNGGTILDPFNGSGSTGKAVMYENYKHDKDYRYIGIELTEEYLPVSKARIEYVCNLPKKVSLIDL